VKTADDVMREHKRLLELDKPRFYAWDIFHALEEFVKEENPYDELG